MKALLLVSMLMSGHAWALQRLPNCASLSKLWEQSYYWKLRPMWRLEPLACDKNESDLFLHEKINIVLARAAYVLNRTEFTDYSVPSSPIVSWGGIEAMPPSMLNRVASRIDRLYVQGSIQFDYAGVTNGVREVHIKTDSFGFKNGLQTGIGMAGLLVHESRHAGPDEFVHVQCRYGAPPIPANFIGPIVENDTNCDETITEEFNYGGAHAQAAL